MSTIRRGPMASYAYTQVRNCWLRDERISWRAKGLLGYLLSHQEGYRITVAQIIRQGSDGKDSVRTALTELQEAGYLVRDSGSAPAERPRTATGHYDTGDWVLLDPFDLAGELLTQAGIPPAGDPATTTADVAGIPPEAREDDLYAGGLPAAVNPPRRRPPGEDQGVVQLHPSAPDPFDAFWAAYPRRVGKLAAQRAWRALVRSGTSPAVIMAGLATYPFTPQVQYQPHPATWLNGRRWEDDPAAVRPQGTARGYGGGGHEPYRNADADEYRQGW